VLRFTELLEFIGFIGFIGFVELRFLPILYALSSMRYAFSHLELLCSIPYAILLNSLSPCALRSALGVFFVGGGKQITT
jgi:hypothetical protein